MAAIVKSGRHDAGRRDWAWLLLAGLLLQGLWALTLDGPGYMDASYYTVNGRILAAGGGFVEPLIWHYLDDPAGLPAPSHTYWQPLPSLLAAGGYLLGDHFRLAQLPFWLLTATLPLLAYAIAGRLGGALWQKRLAGALTAVGGFYAPAWNQPESFAPFAWAGGLALLLLGGERTGRRWLAAGLLCGAAHLARSDGLLLLMVGIAVWLWPGAGRQRLRAALAALLGGYFVVMGGWLARNWLVLGAPLPAAGTQTIFLTNYDDLFAYGRRFALDSYLAWGWGNIARSKLTGAWLAIQSFAAINGLIFLTPFVVWGWWRWRWSAVVRPFTLYTVALFGVMAFVFTFPGTRGGLFHASVALWPWTMALAALGLGHAFNWLAAKRPGRDAVLDRKVYGGMAVGLALALTAAIGILRTPEPVSYAALADALPEDAVVMVLDPPTFHYETGLPAVAVPNEPWPTVRQAAARYGVTHLVLDDQGPQTLAGIYTGEERPVEVVLVGEWEGARVFEVRGEE